MIGGITVEVFRGNKFFIDPAFPFHIERYTIRKRQEIPLHTHDFVELVYVLEGNAMHEMSGITYELRSGDVFVIEPNIYHSYKGADRSEAIVFNVLFRLDLLQRELHLLKEIPSFLDFFYIAPFLRKTATFYPHLTVAGRYKLQFEAHLNSLLREMQDRDSAYRLVIKTRFIECLVHLSRYYLVHDQPQAYSLTDEQWIQSIVSLVEHHYNQPFTLEQLSKLCGMSVPSFTVKFKTVTKKTFVEFKHDIQIREACRMIAESNRKILDIAQEAGFEDLSFFYKVFRKKMGMTPTQYRKFRS
jgi:AraC-like DNA-binding protein/quercetin dioxygenase-like cupin family protein